MLSLIQLFVRRIATRAAYQTLAGNYRDPRQATGDYLSRSQIKGILDQLWKNFDAMLPEANLERYGGLGSRQNAMLGVLSLAAYRTLLSIGFDPAEATKIFADMGWRIYRLMLAVPRFIAHILYRNPQKQMNFILRALLTYPFSYNHPSGYQCKAWEAEDGFYTHWYRCPPLEYVKTQNNPEEVDFFFNTWCQFDYPAAEQMTNKGRFERPHCMSSGDAVCDMRWHVETNDTITSLV